MQVEQLYTLQDFFEFKGCHSLSWKERVAFKLPDTKKGWYKRYKHLTLDSETWFKLIASCNRSKLLQRAEKTLNRKGKSRYKTSEVVSVLKKTKPKQQVYLMCGNNQYKVGISNNVIRRSRELSSASGFPVVIKMVWDVGQGTPRTIERFLHTRFRKYRTLGEWFNFPLDFDVEYRFTQHITEYEKEHNLGITRAV